MWTDGQTDMTKLTVSFRSFANTFDTLYCVKSATLHVSAFPSTSSGEHFYNIEKLSSHNVARITTIKMEIYKSQIFKLQ